MTKSPWESFIEDIRKSFGAEAAALLANLIPSKIKKYANDHGKITLEFPKTCKITVPRGEGKKASLVFKKVMTATIEERRLILDRGEVTWEKDLGPLTVGGSVTEIETYLENGEQKIKFSGSTLANLFSGSEECTLEAAWKALLHSEQKLLEAI